MNVDPDVLEEIKELLEHGIDRHSWPFIEDALNILKEELGYEVEDEEEEGHRHMEEE